jgi:hypothetical protein
MFLKASRRDKSIDLGITNVPTETTGQNFYDKQKLASSTTLMKVVDQ